MKKPSGINRSCRNCFYNEKNKCVWLKVILAERNMSPKWMDETWRNSLSNDIDVKWACSVRLRSDGKMAMADFVKNLPLELQYFLNALTAYKRYA